MKYILCILLFVSLQAAAQKLPDYKNPALPVEARVNDLLSRMNITEKFWQLSMIPGDLDKVEPGQYQHGIFGLQVSAGSRDGNSAQQMMQYNTRESALQLTRKINAIQRYFVEETRLGIPIIAFDEALHGLVRQGSTAFPQSIALAATWDTTLMQQISAAIAWESKQRGIRQILSPVINVATDVRWGRTEETYGEDPLLSSAMGTAYVGGLQRAGIIATPKHFLANVGEGGRDSYPIDLDERILREIYLPPFKACVEKAGAGSIMTAYNSLNGSPCSANSWLLDSILKKEWGFKGFVISDAGAVGGANVLHFTAADYPDAGKKSIANGLDVIFQTAYDHYKLFIPPFLDGSLDTNRINDAVRRVLRSKFELGLFEHPYATPDTLHNETIMQAHRQLSRKAAAESVVLLKNEGDILPLAASVKHLLVVGEDAKEGRLGGYSGPGNNVVSIWEGLNNRLGSSVRLEYQPGCGRDTVAWPTLPANCLFADSDLQKQGLQAAYFNNIGLLGNPVLERNDKQLQFGWTLMGPDPKTGNQFYSVRWTGYLKAPASGDFQIGLEGNDGFRLYINNQQLIDKWEKVSYSRLSAPYHFEKGKRYAIRVEFYETTGNAHINLYWNQGVKDNSKQQIAQAVKALNNTDMAIVVAGIKEGEFQDRAMLSLPGLQEEMIRALAATHKPIVVLLVGGSAICMQNWIDRVKAVASVWYPGEAGGDAIAALLAGDLNPSGKLPISFPLHEGQLPLTYNHKPTGRGDDYNNLCGLPLFPFGYGLSYTQFEYSNSRLEKETIGINDSTRIYGTIRNKGKREGDEVLQLYIRDELASVARPVIELKGFQRIHLKPGESKEFYFTITPDMLHMYNKAMQWVTEPGRFHIMIGSSSREIKLHTVLEVQE
jgi:beta-glucosidase